MQMTKTNFLIWNLFIYIKSSIVKLKINEKSFCENNFKFYWKFM